MRALSFIKRLIDHLAHLVLAAAATSTAIAQQPTVLRSGVELPLYRSSHALVIGVSNYKDWQRLPNVTKESFEVVAALKRQGFLVRHVVDPTGDSLQNAFRDFFAEYGSDPDNRLLVFFGGHGHTIDEIGYLVPADAPDPKENLPLFLKRAQSMSALVSASKEYRAKHALYVFDSCFSGAVFSARSDPTPSLIAAEDISRYLTGPAAFPVRQFITAGNEFQRVPEISQFTPLFLHAIEGRVDDLGKTGFVSAKQLGFWLSKQLGVYTSNQTPRSGTILDSRFDKGDFVFTPPNKPLPIRPAARPEPGSLGIS